MLESNLPVVGMQQRVGSAGSLLQQIEVYALITSGLDNQNLQIYSTLYG